MKLKFILVIPVISLLAAFPFQCKVAVSDGGVFKSLDAGESWKQTVAIDKNKNIAALDILSIVPDLNDNNKIYLGTRSSGLYRSLDAGQTWQKIIDRNSVLSSRAVIHDLAIDPKDSKRIYVAAYQGNRGRVFRSQDEGQSWEQVYVTSRDKYAVLTIGVDATESFRIYIGTAQGGFLQSTDYGKSWQAIKWMKDSINDLIINPLDSKIMYVLTQKQGLLKTYDQGKNWQSLKENMKDFKSAANVRILIMDEQRPNIIYAGSAFGLIKSYDGGQTWQEVKIILPSNSVPILAVAIDSQNSDHIYYGAGSIFYRSLDQGLNWTLHALPTAKTIKTITVDKINSDVIYLGMSQEK